MGQQMNYLNTNAAMVQEIACAASQPRDGGSRPTSPLHTLWVSPIPAGAAKQIVERHHYLHSMPGGTKLAFGVFLGQNLLGALTLGAGPSLAYRLVKGAIPDDCMTLTRLWLSDDLPANSESRAIGIVIRNLKKHTSLKFLVSYADPSAGHVGTIYQATGWLYTGLSEAMPLFDIGDGVAQHSRSLSHSYGSHSVKHFANHGVQLRRISQAPKHRYIYFLDTSWRNRLNIPELPYPKKGVAENENS